MDPITAHEYQQFGRYPPRRGLIGHRTKNLREVQVAEQAGRCRAGRVMAREQETRREKELDKLEAQVRSRYGNMQQ